MGKPLLTETQRAESYKILAGCYYSPDDKLMNTLRGCAVSCGDFVREIGRVSCEIEDVEPLRIDYARLFVGPYKLLASPYGSVYLDEGKFMGASTVDLERLYVENGLDVILKEAPDHISVELEFMYFLILKEIDALKRSDSDGVLVYREKQGAFLTDHLGRWVSPFANQIEKMAESSFYKVLGKATQGLVENDLRELSGTADELAAVPGQKDCPPLPVGKHPVI